MNGKVISQGQKNGKNGKKTINKQNNIQKT